MNTQSEEQFLSRIIRKMESVILADGKVDLEETGVLLRLVKPLAEDYGSDFRAFEMALRDVRSDGVVTPEESERLRQLIVALADRAEDYKVVPCPACQRPLSIRATAAENAVCPWCGETISR